jgi:hypothetical protein
MQEKPVGASCILRTDGLIHKNSINLILPLFLKYEIFAEKFQQSINYLRRNS